MATLSHISLCPKPYSSQAVEIVERKGIGHPDTICDALAEELSSTIRVSLPDAGNIDTIQKSVDEIVNQKLQNMDQIRHMLVSGAMLVY